MPTRIKPHSLRTEDLRHMERTACTVVLDEYVNVKSTVGTPGAIDYAKITGGRGAQFRDDDCLTTLLDFSVDVEKALKDTLSQQERSELLVELMDAEKHTFTIEFMKVQERLGRVFISRSLYPLNRYFTTIRGKEPSVKSGVV